MKPGFYAKLAMGNLKKNARFFVPHIFTGGGLLACFYIIFTLSRDQRLAEVRGGEYIPTLMGMATWVMAILSLILLLYTNSFLMKQRLREFGLYNVLGMEKRHVGRVMLFETLFSGLCSLVPGLGGGILFYKLSALFICRLLAVDSVFGFYYISLNTIVPSVAFFAAIQAVAYAFNRIRLRRMKPVELLQSAGAGEREPKVRKILLAVGVASLAAGYILALATKSPLQALSTFFIAVLLVILGTYCLFISGSIFVLKALKRNEKFYYNKKHMAAVAGLLYRMKQNAVGLASISIFATGVLVMVSTTVTLYAGMEDALQKNYPQHLYLNASYYYEGEADAREIPEKVLLRSAQAAADAHHVQIEKTEIQRYLEVSYLKNGTVLSSGSPAQRSVSDLQKLVCLIIMTKESYRELTGESLSLQKEEAALCPLSALSGKPEKALTVDGIDIRVKKVLTAFPVRSDLASTEVSYGMVVADEAVFNRLYEAQKRNYGEHASEITTRLAVTYRDAEAASAEGKAMENEINAALARYVKENAERPADAELLLRMNTVWSATGNLYGSYGVFLFLGMILGLVFLFAAALIIYYKQISEGYEDRARFRIMEKVGMSEKEVKRSVSTQILLVFFLPLAVAAVHTAAAFPILTKLMLIFALPSTGLFVFCTVITLLVFAVIYVLIYAATARAYYRIVH